MKTSLRILSFIVLCSALCIACNNNNSNKNTDVIRIDLETMVDQNRNIGLAEIAREVSYIPLETVPEAMLNPTKVLYVNKNIFVLNRNKEIFLFDDKGKFIRQIGTIGKGPGEYVGAQYMEVSPDGSLIYIYNQRFGNAGYTYDLEGNQINSFKMAYATWRFAPLAEGRHIMISPYGSFSPDSAKFLFYLQDKTGKVIRKYPSTKVIKMMGDFSVGNFFIDPIRVLAYQPFCDTVFQVDGDGTMNPAFILNYGDHHAPDELYDDMQNIMAPTQSFYLTPTLRQTKDYLFIGIKEKQKYHIGMYDFDNEDIISFKTDNNLIPNDLDGGPDFWPSGTDGDHVLYRMVEPIDMLNPDEKNKLELKDPDAAEAYNTLLKSLTENDNPVVMVVRLK